MPSKPSGNTGPFEKLLRGEDPMASTKKAEERRKRANQEAYRYRDETPLEGGPERPPGDYAEEIPDPSQSDSLPSRIRSYLSQSPCCLWIGFAAFFVLMIQGTAHWALASSVTQFRAQYMEDQWLEAKRAWCLGTSRQLRRFYVNRMWLIEKNYRASMKRPVDMLTCREMGLPELLVDEP